MTRIKICGITNLEDAQVAIEAGADMLGFNFYPRSPRYIEPAAARAIIDRVPEDVRAVGVFVNEETSARVEQIADEARVSILQLHGDESPEFCAALADREVIRVLSVGDHFNPERALDYNVWAIMLDASTKEARGGTGQTIDWSIARRVRELVPRLFLAGGLSPDNVADAIRVVCPYAVDACSALERTPGRKSADRVREFVRSVASSKTDC